MSPSNSFVLLALSLWGASCSYAQEPEPTYSLSATIEWMIGFEKNTDHIIEPETATVHLEEYLKSNPTIAMAVFGSADTLEADPNGLSRKRALAIRSLLVEQGVSPDRLIIRDASSSEVPPVTRCSCAMLRPMAIAP